MTNSSGTLLAINDYDEFGVPGSGNLGAWGYTGQAWIAAIGVQYSKARMYDPELGRFLQTDPIGYAGGLNLYAYVGNDPINLIDPLGLDGEDDIEVWGWRPVLFGALGGAVFGGTQGGFDMGAFLRRLDEEEIVVTARRRQRASVPDFNPRPIPHFEWPKRPLSQCWVNFLGRHAKGFDWSKVTISRQHPLPGQGASTALNTIYAGFGFRNIESHTFFFLHELGHLPQWASGRLTTLGYIGQTISTSFKYMHGMVSSVHDSIPIEAEADAFARRMQAAYDKEKRPCD